MGAVATTKYGKRRLRGQSAHSGKRQDLGGRYFRSAWEANYARYLEQRLRAGEIAGWAYEPRTFEFEGLRHGCVSYTPDFRVDYPDGRCEWVEVKGYMSPQSKTKLKRFGVYYPDESARLTLVDGPAYQALDRQCRKTVPGWE